MKVILLVASVFAVLGAQNISPTQYSSVIGSITQSITNEPIEGVSAQIGGRSTTTDHEGQFVKDSIAPSRDPVTVTVQREGYVLAGSSGTQPSYSLGPVRSAINNSGNMTAGAMTIGPGEIIREFHVELAPEAKINGKVVNPDGTPAAGVSVQLSEVIYEDGHRRLLLLFRPGVTSETDDKGQYRKWGLPAGEYIVRSSKFGPWVPSGNGQARPGQTSSATFQKILPAVLPRESNQEKKL